ncbi:MAG TPA: cytochrome c [Thermoanaerobaculia bacterium]|nr:cytochrome c [Thermoanaerobaculia bacterium]
MRLFRLSSVVLVVLALALPVFAEDGAALYKAKCVGCHAADGTGSPMGKKLGAKPLGSADIQKLSDSDLQKAITGGKNKMPPFKTLSAEQIKSLLAEIRTFAKK